MSDSLIKIAFKIGLSIDQLRSIDMHQFNLFIDEFEEHKKNEAKDQLALAVMVGWQTIRFLNSKKMKKLDVYLDEVYNPSSKKVTRAAKMSAADLDDLVKRNRQIEAAIKKESEVVVENGEIG